jgi:hypothetical protein
MFFYRRGVFLIDKPFNGRPPFDRLYEFSAWLRHEKSA